MAFIKEVLIERFDRSLREETNDHVVSEERIAFYLNGEKLLSVMSLAMDQDAHFAGFLLSEGVIDSVDKIRSIDIADDGLSVYLEAQIDEQNRKNLFAEKTLTSGCCVGVTGNVEGSVACSFLQSDYRVRIGDLLERVDKFALKTPLFEQTGALHRALIALESGEEFSAEDIGRHNAIDKAAGKARLSGFDLGRSLLISSGRLSMEMAMKCAMHRIPIVVSKAAVTLQGIRAAQTYGVTMAGFARNGKINLYTHSGRIAP
ncbi:MAG: formate dehydrogenase accessory sulfurtransferase FdhD [Helicobacteraceae bacterium]|jgi:FdhD protein|nr:formate dehydrogenase accessory sulfurtransferase FdhD [Helicobacteraceae bacterium]